VVQVDPIQAAFTERIPEQPGNSVWHTLPLGNKFPTQPGKVERPDFSVNEQFPTVELLWEQPLGELITAPPAFSAEMAYAVTAEGQIAALDLQKGNKLWTYQTSGGIHGQPLVVDDRVICGSADSSIYCLDAHDGELLWVRRLAGSALNVPVQSGKRIFVAAGEGSFYALDIASGEILWEYHDIDGFVETRPTIKGNRIMFGAWDNRVYALHIRNGKTQWIWQDGPQGILYSPAACWPVASRRQLLFAAPDRALTAVDLRTGETVWRSKERRVRETIGMTPDAEIAFAKCMWDTVIAFRTDHADYDEIWARHVGYGFEIDPSMLVAGAEAVYLTTQNGSIYALDIQNGNVIWQYRLSAALLHTPVLLPDESILLSGVDGIVRRIKFGT